MEPVTATAIVAAVTAGMTAGMTAVGKKLSGDAYEALKSALKRKFGGDSQVVKAVDSLEADPQSQGFQMVVKEQLAKARADEDTDIRKAAEVLLQRLEAEPSGPELLSNAQTAIGSNIAQAGYRSTAQVFAPPSQATPPKQ